MKLTKTLLTTAILGFSLASCHSTVLTNTPDQQLDQGFEAVKKGDYQTALKLWKPLADQGDARAQYNLGLMYRDGEGVKQNRTVAKEWLGKACDNGDKKGCLYYKKLK